MHLKSDNTTAVSYIKYLGGTHSLQLNKLAREIWLWCLNKKIWLSVSFLPGIENVSADFASRHFHEDIEWKLHPEVFRKIIDIFMTPNIDMFASRLNHQIQPYVSWKPDPNAIFNDAFTLDWSNYKIYAFPPFCLIGKVLTKIEYEESTAILVAPLWHTQAWFPKMQIQPYVSWKPDPNAIFNDAFTLDWSNYKIYAFPPFCLIGKVLTKIEYEESTAILVAPLWHTQAWFPKMLKLLVNKTIILPKRANLLSLPSSCRLHPLRDRLQLMACHLSGKPTEPGNFAARCRHYYLILADFN